MGRLPPQSRPRLELGAKQHLRTAARVTPSVGVYRYPILISGATRPVPSTGARCSERRELASASVAPRRIVRPRSVSGDEPLGPARGAPEATIHAASVADGWGPAHPYSAAALWRL